MILQGKKFIVVEHYEYKETGSINSVQSSLQSHGLWDILVIE